MATIPAFSAPDWLKTETAEQIQARMMESLPTVSLLCTPYAL